MSPRDYIFYYQKHQEALKKYKQVKCGKDVFLRWDCVRFFIEDDMNLHQRKRQNSYLVGKQQGTDTNFDDTDLVEPGIIIEVHRKPWYTRLVDSDGPRWEEVYYPPPIQAALAVAGVFSLPT